MNTAMTFEPNQQISKWQSVKAWAHIMLSYVFVSALVATLICAYQQQANIFVITIFLVLGAAYGTFKAEQTRKTVGLGRYNKKN